MVNSPQRQQRMDAKEPLDIRQIHSAGSDAIKHILWINLTLFLCSSLHSHHQVLMNKRYQDPSKLAFNRKIVLCPSITWLRSAEVADLGVPWSQHQGLGEFMLHRRRSSPVLQAYGLACGNLHLVEQLVLFYKHHLWFAFLSRVQGRASTPEMQADWLYLEGLASAL